MIAPFWGLIFQRRQATVDERKTRLDSQCGDQGIQFASRDRPWLMGLRLEPFELMLASWLAVVQYQAKQDGGGAIGVAYGRRDGVRYSLLHGSSV